MIILAQYRYCLKVESRLNLTNTCLIKRDEFQFLKDILVCKHEQ